MTPISWEIGQILSWTFIAFIMRQIMVFLLSTPHLCSCCLVIKSCPTLCDPMDCSTPGLPVLHHESLLKLMSTELVMSSHPLILCHPLLLLPSIFLSIRFFSNASTLHIRWPKYWSFSFSINPSNEYSGLISFRIDWFDLLAVQGTFKSLLQHSNTSPILWSSSFFISTVGLYFESLSYYFF